MAEPAVFRLGIVGGCMSHQPGIALSELYHRRLAERVEAGTGIRLRVHVARAFGADYRDRLAALLAGRELDGVLLHVRVVTRNRARLVIPIVRDGRRRHALHPALLRRTHHGERVEALRALETAGEQSMGRAGRLLAERAARHDRRSTGRRIAGFRWKTLNYALGALFGLDRWTVDDEMVVLQQFLRACGSRSLPVFLLGPTPLTGRYWQARAPRELAARLRRFAEATGTRLAVIDATHDEQGCSLLKGDGMHLTPAGHAFVAARLHDAGMADWISSVVAARAASVRSDAADVAAQPSLAGTARP